MAAVDAAIVVQLVDNHIAQVFEVTGPARVVRQDAAVQHVGIRQHDVGALTDSLARVLRGIAVVSESADLGAHLLEGLVEFVKLIFGQRLGREQIQGARAGIAQQQVHHGQVVTERFAAGGGSHDDHIAPGLDVPEGFRLVRIQARDAASFERRAQAFIHPRRNLAEDSLGGRLVVNGADRGIGILLGRSESSDYSFKEWLSTKG